MRKTLREVMRSALSDMVALQPEFFEKDRLELPKKPARKPKNISCSRKKSVARRKLSLTLLDAVRQVGDEAFQEVYKLALQREELRRKGVEPPPLQTESPD